MTERRSRERIIMMSIERICRKYFLACLLALTLVSSARGGVIPNGDAPPDRPPQGLIGTGAPESEGGIIHTPSGQPSTLLEATLGLIESLAWLP
jgi:hypothetical protein